MARTPTPKLQVTKNYSLFNRSDDNRPLDLSEHKTLKQSMQRYGFIPSQPMSVVRHRGKLVVKDGQHRLAFAEELGLPVYYVVDDADWDIATVNSTPKSWTPLHYALKFAANGLQPYVELLTYFDRHPISIGICIGLLSGSVKWTHFRGQFQSGQFEIRDREWADNVANLYTALIAQSPSVKGKGCLNACMAVCRVDKFDAKRLLRGASRRREKLVSYSTRDASLVMFEELYNLNQKKRVPIKFLAEEAMAKRNAVTPKSHT